MPVDRFSRLVLGTGLTGTDLGDGSIELDAAGGSGVTVATDTIWDTKGDIAVASGADAASKLAAGTNGYVLTADSAQTLGLKWAAAAAGAAGSTFYNGTGAPSSGLGANGDYYIRTDTGALYVKAAGAWSVLMSLYGNATMAATWQGTMPATLGNGVELRVPKLRGASVTFHLNNAWARVTTPGAATSTFRLEKSSGGGAFSGTTVSTLSIAAAGYEVEDTGVSINVTSGDLLRIVFTALGTTGLYSVQLQGVQT